MKVVHVYTLALIAFLEFLKASSQAAKDDDHSIIKSLTKNHGFKNVQLNDRKRLGNNPFQDDFLKKHFKPSVFYDGDFNLKADPTYIFKPPIRKSPMRSSGKPWPLPQEYKTNNSKIFTIDAYTFRIKILNRTCDVLEQAIKRTMEIVSHYSLEDPYEFVLNLDPISKAERLKQTELRKGAQPLRTLDVYVSDTKEKYPSIKSDESYRLSVTSTGAMLVAREVWGALRGLETFSQLIVRNNVDALFIKETNIFDYPRFPHRGVLIDTARHYIQIPVIKEVLEGMYVNKMNVLHWHIVDDNSFPYQSKVFPDLSGKGAYHPKHVYTIENIKELIEFARLRGIRIVPEFDSPGHTFSWGLGYPDLKSHCSKTASYEIPVGPVDPSKSFTYDFMKSLFREIFEVFTDKFVHLGGDELHSLCWTENENILRSLSELGHIPQETAKRDPQGYVNLAIGYYFKRLVQGLVDVAKETRQKGASFIMWEDVLKNTREIPKDSILQVWYGRQTNVRLLNQQGYRALYSSCWYLDHVKDSVQWTTYYLCEPSPYSTDAEEHGKLLGGEACLWSEYIVSENLMTTMWPRTSAIAERLWSSRRARDVNEAGRRFQEQKCRMLYRGLPVGHGSGPDYCLRASSRPSYLESDEIKDSVFKSVIYNTDYNLVGKQTMQSMLRFLPVVNIVITVAGLYLIVLTSRCCRRRFRDINSNTFLSYKSKH